MMWSPISQCRSFPTAAAVALVFAATSACAGETIVGRVVGVSDGDTITVLDSRRLQVKVRLAGIDAPESKQAFGQASRKHLSSLVFDRDVTLDCGKSDKYRRHVCVVVVDGRDVNLAQIAAGMAWWYRCTRRSSRLSSGSTMRLPRLRPGPERSGYGRTVILCRHGSGAKRRARTE